MDKKGKGKGNKKEKGKKNQKEKEKREMEMERKITKIAAFPFFVRSMMFSFCVHEHL